MIGIWPKNVDKGNINCAHLSNGRKTLATGDDFGFVKLFKFPVSVKFVSCIPTYINIITSVEWFVYFLVDSLCEK